MNAENDKLIFKVKDNKVFGFLRFGLREFDWNLEGKKIKIQIICVIDFYVHHLKQRDGMGKNLFDKMLRFANVSVNQIGFFYANKTIKNFLQKYYKLDNLVSITDAISISENFVSFNNKIFLILR